MNLKSLTIALGLASCLALTAKNPIIQDRFTPDPAPYVHGDTLYLFVDHDAKEDIGYFNMPDWLLYSTTDMVNWTYRGTPVKTDIFSWAKQNNDAWAAQCIERNGKWYWYVTATVEGKGYPGIGVAVADRPEGPYRDAIGKPIAEGWFYIDPTVFIDDNGQAYLFWGNNNLWYAKLSKSMTSLGQIKKVDTLDESAFGPYKGYEDNGNPRTNYEEAPWIYRLGDTYYLEYAAGGVPEFWAYSTAPSVDGPWTYRGRVMDQAHNSFTIHGGSVHYRGHDYMFYHNGGLPNGGGFRRSTCIEEFTRNADGSIPFIPFTSDKDLDQLEYVDPSEWVEAETVYSLNKALCDGGGDLCYLSILEKSATSVIKGVDFGNGDYDKLIIRVAAAQESGQIKVMVHTPSRATLAKFEVPNTGGLDQWQEIEVDLRNVPAGAHDLYFSYTGNATDGVLFNIDRWRMTGANALPSVEEAPACTQEYYLNGLPCEGQAPRGTITVKDGKKRLN